MTHRFIKGILQKDYLMSDKGFIRLNYYDITGKDGR